MNLLIYFLVQLTTSSYAGTPPPLPIGGPTLADIVENVGPGVVNISSVTVSKKLVFGWDEFLRLRGIPVERANTSLGSGFLLDKEGYIFTNEHVVHDADEVIITLLDKRQFTARLIGLDPKMDIALLQIRDKNKKIPADLKPVNLGDSNTVRVAEHVFAVGNPFGLNHTVTAGIISAKDRSIGRGAFDHYLQTDAAINPGNSGGPLFNLKGEVIGINRMILSSTNQSAGVGMAIPINDAKKVFEDLKRYGRVPRPWLGVMADQVTAQTQRHYRLPLGQGVLVYDLAKDGPAFTAGIRQGDILVEVDGTPVTTLTEVEVILAKHRPKDKISAKFNRNGKEKSVTLNLEELPKVENLPQGIV
jgi:serine protease Do